MAKTLAIQFDATTTSIKGVPLEKKKCQMAEEAAKAVLVPITERVITPAVEAFGRQLGYIFCYRSNIKTLQMKVGQLEIVGMMLTVFSKHRSGIMKTDHILVLPG